MLVPIYKMKKVIKKIVRGKGEIVRVEMDRSVAPDSLELWHKRGFQPSDKGIAVVKYPTGDKEYFYPLLWEVSDDSGKRDNRPDRHEGATQST